MNRLTCFLFQFRRINGFGTLEDARLEQVLVLFQELHEVQVVHAVALVS